MGLNSLGDGSFELILTGDELNVLFACLRESFATLGKNSYQTRIGVTMDVGSALGD
ncbi:hypothetical protein D3C71_881850 [compost metagenome]